MLCYIKQDIFIILVFFILIIEEKVILDFFTYFQCIQLNPIFQVKLSNSRDQLVTTRKHCESADTNIVSLESKVHDLQGIVYSPFFILLQSLKPILATVSNKSRWVLRYCGKVKFYPISQEDL